MSLAKEIGERIRTTRELLKWSQGRLARRSGLSVASISRYEAGETVPGGETILALSEGLGIEPGWLLSGGGKRTSLRQRIFESASMELAPHGDDEHVDVTIRFSLDLLDVVSIWAASKKGQLAIQGLLQIDENYYPHSIPSIGPVTHRLNERELRSLATMVVALITGRSDYARAAVVDLIEECEDGDVFQELASAAKEAVEGDSDEDMIAASIALATAVLDSLPKPDEVPG